MKKMQAGDVAQDPDALWSAARLEPVTVELEGRPIAVVLSPQAYSELIARRNSPGMSASVRRRSLTTDSNDLFGLDGDIFCNYGP